MKLSEMAFELTNDEGQTIIFSWNDLLSKEDGIYLKDQLIVSNTIGVNPMINVEVLEKEDDNLNDRINNTINDTIDIIMLKEGLTKDEAKMNFIQTRTFQALLDPHCDIHNLKDEQVYAIYHNEKETGLFKYWGYRIRTASDDMMSLMNLKNKK